MNNYQDEFTNMCEADESNICQSFPNPEFTPYENTFVDASTDVTDGQQRSPESLVTFNAHGGVLPPGTHNPRWVWNGTAIGTLPIPTRPGFIFQGWWSGNLQIHANTVIWHNMTLMASWRSTPIELLPNSTVQAIRGNTIENVPLQDLLTGRTFRISMCTGPGNLHTDWTPMSPADVTTIKRIIDPQGIITNWNLTSSWSWAARPGVLSLNGRRIAVGFHLMPHSIIIPPARPGSPLQYGKGHMCMFYGNSRSNPALPGFDLDMNNAARRAHSNWQ